MQQTVKFQYDVLGPRVVSSLVKRGFDAYYVNDCQEALSMALELIKPTDTVGYGGSLTINQVGIKEALRKRENVIFERDNATNEEERKAYERQALGADWFLMSSNGISEDGQLVNVDGFGNRVASLIYGPKNVLVICGMNKICPTVEDACKRARKLAAPANLMRFPGKTCPCVITGSCTDCIANDCGCNTVVISRRSNPAGRIKIILVGDELGL